MRKEMVELQTLVDNVLQERQKDPPFDGDLQIRETKEAAHLVTRLAIKYHVQFGRMWEQLRGEILLRSFAYQNKKK